LVARHVQRGPGGGKLVLPSLVGAEDAVDLPAAQHRLRSAAGGPLLAVAEWGFIHIAKLKRVGDVIRRRGAVPREHTRRVPDKGRPVTVVGHIDSMRIGVSTL